MEEILMETSESKVEVSLRKPKVQGFLKDLIELCTKHKVFISTHLEGTKVSFYNWDCFINLEADPEGASLYCQELKLI
jgi:hypothetical protein